MVKKRELWDDGMEAEFQIIGGGTKYDLQAALFNHHPFTLTLQEAGRVEVIVTALERTDDTSEYCLYGQWFSPHKCQLRLFQAEYSLIPTPGIGHGQLHSGVEPPLLPRLADKQIIINSGPGKFDLMNSLLGSGLPVFHCATNSLGMAEVSLRIELVQSIYPNSEWWNIRGQVTYHDRSRAYPVWLQYSTQDRHGVLRPCN